MKPSPGQASFWDHTAREQLDAVPVNSTVDPEDVPRLSAQHRAILERLRQSPATNAELSRIALRFGARLHELERAGHPHGKVNFGEGVFCYFLVGVHSSNDAERYGREKMESFLLSQEEQS